MSSGCSRLLVANRGEIARRVMATARDMGIETVAVYASGDRDAPFVAEADQAVALGGSSAADSYLDQTRILAAAAATGADAIHPGYGFLSENASFAAAVIDAGLTWVGPPPAAIAAMGDKLAAKRLMDTIGVPTLPSVEVAKGHADGSDAAELVALAETVGYPLLVKAAAGGGGKGMRVVADPADLAEAVAGAVREAAAAFGDGTVFLERYLTAPRHIEIQVIADRHGAAVHGFERECSIQRRHQKIIEEAPSPAIDDDLRAAMGRAALAAVAAIDYHSVGTVEFLVDCGIGPGGATGVAAAAEPSFFFLEVNTRLQVEHPVTEAVTGLDLVREQIRIARGEPLGYGQDDLAIAGHAVEARLYAEDVAAGFLPATGKLRAFETRSEPSVRVDSGVETGSVVGVEFDPLLAKVIAHGPNRTEAAARLALALDRMTLAGVITNRSFLVETLRHPAFLAGDTTTDFIQRFGLVSKGVGSDTAAAAPADALGDAVLGSLVSALVLVRSAANRARPQPLGFLRPAYRNSTMPDETLSLVVGTRRVTVGYRSGRDGMLSLQVRVEQSPGGDGDGPVPLPNRLAVRKIASSGTTLHAEIDGIRSRYDVVGDQGRWHVQGPRGRADFVELPRFPEPGAGVVAGGQMAPMPGTVRVVAVAAGDQVEAGQTLVVLEAMKMEHTVRAPDDGVVSAVTCVVDQQVDTGDILVVVEPA